MDRNITSLLGLRITKKLIYTFIDVFVSAYFFQLSNNNAVILSKFYIPFAIFIFLTMFLLKDLMKSKNRNLIIQAGILLEIVYLVAFLVLKEKSVNYAILIGILRGIASGAYYSIYNTWEVQGITPTERHTFIGVYKVLSGISVIIFPTVAGYIIGSFGYSAGFLCVIVLSCVALIFSLMFEDKVVKTSAQKFRLKEFIKSVKHEKRYKYLAACNLMNGFTYSDGAFATLITIYIIRVFKTSISLGIVTTITNLFTILLGICVSSVFRKNYLYSRATVLVTTCFEVISFIIMLLEPNYITIPLFTLCNNIHCDVISTEENFGYNNLITKSSTLKGFTEEYILFSEIFLVIARVSGFLLLIIYAVTYSNLIVILFLVFILLGTLFADKLYSTTIE